MSAKLKEFGFIKCYSDINFLLKNDENNNDFKNSIISISGFGELICFGIKKKLIIASLNCVYNPSSSSQGITYNMVSQEDICGDYISNEYITTVFVLPISSLKQSSQGLPDWTCICVGLSTGEIKFFNQFGQLVFSQKLHSSAIKSISLRRSPRPNQPDIFNEDLMILCNSCCFQIDGVYLYASLNNFKKQLVRFQAGFLDDQWNSYELIYKKWLLDSQEGLSGIIFGYETCDTIIDSIFNNVTNKGPFLTISEDVTTSINCVVVGKLPFIAFYKVPIESDSLDMGDLAHAVYSKVKGALSSSISSWMGSFSFSAPAQQQVPKLIPKNPDTTVSEIPSRLLSRNIIEEPSRQASMVVGCPHHNKRSKLAAMTDDYGRIFLLDIDDGIVLRMWKGYRDAQISISSTTDGSVPERSVNYLVIYAPRRSLIEVWTLPFGEKVASFDVREKNGRLLHVPHSSLGSSLTQSIQQKTKNSFSSFFLDSNGKISIFDIPFHLSLSSSSNERSQDHLVLKHFKNVIRNENTKSEFQVIRTEFSSSLRLLRLSCSIEVLLTTIVNMTYLPHEIIISVLEELSEVLTEKILTFSSPENDVKRLINVCIGYKSLIICFKTLTDIKTVEKLTSDIQNMEKLFKIESDDCQRIMNLFKYYSRFNQRIKVMDSESTYLLFINNFTMLPNSSEEKCDGFQLSKNALEKDVIKIGSIFFKQCLMEELSVEVITNLLRDQIKIDQSSCFRLFLSYIINEDSTILTENLARFKEMFCCILSPLNLSKTDFSSQFRLLKASLLLSNDMVEKSSNIMASLLIAMTIRVIILDFFQSGITEKEEILNNLSGYLSSWNGICQRFEDIMIFDCFLKCCPLLHKEGKSKKAKVTFDQELILFNVLENGKGIFSERFAKWALKWNLRYSHINELYKSLADRSCIADPMDEDSSLNSEVKDIFAILYKQLPHSLEYESVLINVAWEYTRLWSKSIQRVEYLECACDLLENLGLACGVVIQGIGSMIWDMHIVVGLLGIFPANKHSSPQYSSQLSLEVTILVIRLLKILLKALDSADVTPTFTTESVWHGEKCRTSLIDMAVNKDPITVSSLELHIQLLYAMQLTFMLDRQDLSCQSLFSKETRKHIFKQLTANVKDSMINDNVKCKFYRIKFLESCIGSCVKLFNETTENNNLCEKTKNIVKSLGLSWSIDLEDIRQCWIRNYYMLGLDSQGSMYLDKVDDLPLLGLILLKIVASRIKKEYLFPETKYYRECSKYVTSHLKRWLHSIDETLLRDTVLTSLDSTSILLDQILEWIPENSLDFEAATCLQSVIINIQRTRKFIE